MKRPSTSSHRKRSLLLGLALLIPSPLLADEPPTEGTLTLFQSDHRVLVMMRIGDDELVPMVFDTGSDGHSIDSLLVKRHHLKTIGETIEVDGTTGKRRTLPRVAVPDVRLGGLKVGTIEAVALDYNRDDAMGIISPEMFERSLVYVELAHNRARLVPRQGATRPSQPPVRYRDAIPSIPIEMPDGSTLLAQFDTGFDAALSLPIELMHKVPLIEPPRIVGRFQSIDSEGDVYGGQVRGSIRIGPVTLDNPEVTFLGHHANIGLPVLRRITLVLDPAENQSWVLDPTNVPAPPSDPPRQEQETQ
jgi:hypothetical protein